MPSQATLATDFLNHYHPLQATGGRDELIDSWRLVFAGSRVSVDREDIATVGDNLALCRSRFVIEARKESVEPFGSALLDQLVVIEVDDGGRIRLGEVFGADDLEGAMARLHELHAQTPPLMRTSPVPRCARRSDAGGSVIGTASSPSTTPRCTCSTIGAR